MSATSPSIAYVCQDRGIPIDGSKGAAVHFRQMAAALRRQGAVLDVYAARADGRARDAVHVLDVERCAGIPGELAQLAANAEMSAALERGGRHDVVYERFSLFAAAGLAHAKRSGIPLFLEVNAPLWEEAAQFRSLHLADTARGLALDVLRAADRVLVVSAALAERLQAAGVEAGALRVLGNGVDAAAFGAARPAPRPAQLEGLPVAVFVGSLKPWHGVEFLLRAHARAQEQVPFGLWIVGDGPMRGAVRAAAAVDGGRVAFAGAVAHERIAEILAAADVSIAPYPAAAPDYFSPLKVVEAMAARCPLVASRTRCVVDSLRPDAVHELFEPDDEASFVAAMQRALSRLPAARVQGVPDGMAWDDNARSVLAMIGEVAAPCDGGHLPSEAGA